MANKDLYESYPAGMVFTSVLHTLLIYALGVAILLPAGPIWAALYLAFCLWSEFRVLRGSCVNCAYYGKSCAFGRGIVCAMIFRRGDPARFNQRRLTWAALIPDLMISQLPLIVGIVLLVRDFSWLLLGLMVLLVLLAFPGSGFVRGRLACAHCRQRELGCPAERLFGAKSRGAGRI